MGHGIARTAAGNGLRAAACAAALVLTSPSGAQAPVGVRSPVGEVSPPETLATSAGCKAPAADIATPAPLPHLAEKLKARSVLKVLAIGSASTAGIGASSPAQGYTGQLEQILEGAYKGLDVVMVNRGVSGESASVTASRLKNEVALTRPDLVLWQVGTNDALARIPVEEFVATVRETLGWLKEHGIDTVLIGLQYGRKVAADEHYAAIRNALREVADSENVLLVRRWEAMRFIEKTTATNLHEGDDLHFNDLGYQCMAEHVAQMLVASAFLRPGSSRPQP